MLILGCSGWLKAQVKFDPANPDISEKTIKKYSLLKLMT